MASKIDLISNALILIGDLPITSLTGNARAQVVSTKLYDNVVQAELSKYRWGFARKKVQLSKSSVAPVGTEFQTQYALPSDLIQFIKVNPPVNYQILASTIDGATASYVQTDYNGDLFCDYICNITEASFPAYFEKVVEYALAKDFALAIRDSATVKEAMAAEYENASRMARYTDSQQHPITPIQDRPFIDVRY
jgi:hypothetical protein